VGSEHSLFPTEQNMKFPWGIGFNLGKIRGICSLLVHAGLEARQ
jgi:hypothetical protein